MSKLTECVQQAHTVDKLIYALGTMLGVVLILAVLCAIGYFVVYGILKWRDR